MSCISRVSESDGPLRRPEGGRFVATLGWRPNAPIPDAPSTTVCAPRTGHVAREGTGFAKHACAWRRPAEVKGGTCHLWLRSALSRARGVERGDSTWRVGEPLRLSLPGVFGIMCGSGVRDPSAAPCTSMVSMRGSLRATEVGWELPAPC